MIPHRLTTPITAFVLAAVLAIGCSDDSDSSAKDTGVKPDGKAAVDSGGTADSGQYSGPNSGKLCDGDKDCTGANEICLKPYVSKRGMCLNTCTPGTQCPHPYPGPYAADCAFRYSASGTTSYACGWYCAYQGVTYKCPNDTEYQCWAPTATEPNVKFCVPK